MLGPCNRTFQEFRKKLLSFILSFNASCEPLTMVGWKHVGGEELISGGVMRETSPHKKWRDTIADVTRETVTQTSTASTITITATASQFAGFAFNFTMATSTATPIQSISLVFSQLPRLLPEIVGVFFLYYYISLNVKLFPLLIVLVLTLLLAHRTSTATPIQSISLVFSQLPRLLPEIVGVFFIYYYIFLNVKHFPLLIVLVLTLLLALFWVPGC